MSETPNTFSFDTLLAVLNEEFCDPTFNIDNVEKTNELRKIEAEDIAFLGGLPSEFNLDNDSDDEVEEAATECFDNLEMAMECEEGSDDEVEIEDAHDNDGAEVPIDNGPVAFHVLQEEIAKNLDMVANPCCTKLCLNGWPYQLMLDTMTNMAMLPEQQRVRLLHHVAAFGTAPQPEDLVERRRKRRAKTADISLLTRASIPLAA